MRSLVVAAAVVMASALAVAPSVSDAKRFGGGSSSGMQRSMPNSTPAKPVTPAQQAAPAAAPTAAAGTAAAATKRSWMGPIAGLAAGLGIAALMSHLGLGEAFGNFLMLALLAVVAVVAIRFLMRRFGSPAVQPREQLAAAGAPPVQPQWTPQAEPPVTARTSSAPTQGAVLSADGSTALAPMPGSTVASVVPSNLPADFDAEGFSRLAKMIFIRMQAAHDSGDLNDLRSFTTPEMFAVAKLDLQERGGKTQNTDVVHVDADVLDLAKEGERHVVSVRFHGQIREEADGPVQDFDEIWHLTRFGDNPAWSIAGIQQRH